MKVTKKEKQNTTNAKKRKNKYKIHANVVKKRSGRTDMFRIFLISLESDFRVSILPEFISSLNLNVLWFV